MDKGKRERSHFDDEIFFIGESVYYRGTPPGAKKQREVALGLKKGALQKDILRRKDDVIKGLERVGSKTGKNSFDIISQDYIKDREKEAENPDHLSQKTLSETKQLMKDHLQKYFGSRRVEEIDQKSFNDYCELKSKKNLALPNHRKIMNHFFRWCVTEGYLKYRTELAIPKKGLHIKRQRIVLSDDEIKSLIQAYVDLISEDELEIKHILYLVLYLFMGMRNMEICKLRWDEIDFEKRALKINKMNNRRRKERALPVNSYAIDLLKGWYARDLFTRSIREALHGTPKQKAHAKVYFMRAEEWVFPSRIVASKKPYTDPSGGFRHGWDKALKRAGLGHDLTPHDCRAMFETFMHTNPLFTDTQREKMAGASIDVQKKDYVTMNVDRIRGLEESVQIEGLPEMLREITRENREKKAVSKPVKVRNKKGNRK